MTLLEGSNISGLLARQMNVGTPATPLVTALVQGSVNTLGAANTVLTTDGATAGGAWGLLVNANIAAAAAIAGTKIAPDFGAQDITTTGNFLLGATPATAGDMRVNHGFTMEGRNSVDGANLDIIGWGNVTANVLRIGDSGSAGIDIRDDVSFNSIVEFGNATVRWEKAVVAPVLGQVAENNAVNAETMTISAQINTNAGAFNGGNLALTSGSSVGGTAGTIALQVAGTPHFTITATGEANFEVPSPALGGGAAATLGTIGGAGPTVAGQNQWLQIEIDATTHWVAVWV